MCLKHTVYKSTLLILVVVFALPFLAAADGFKFKLKNTSKATVTVFYKVSKRSGDFKLKSLARLLAGEETVKSVSVNRGDTIAFYGQNPEDETSAIVKKD